MWLAQLDALADMRRCVAMDLRGYGRSARTELDALTMGLLADDVAGMIRWLGEERADIVSLSMGGYVTFALWQRHPQVVRSLALFDTRSAADSEQERARRADTAQKVLVQGRGWLAETLAPALLGSRPSLAAQARLRSMIESTPYETIVASLSGMAQRADLTSLLPSISVPVLVAVGAEDNRTPPSMAQAIAAAIPGAQLLVVPGAGHLTPIETPQLASQALRSFLE
jgi:pimeloyl-ACP methyl ester carboxylesterase